MSLFLGKIHYWLFNKILWFEGLEDEIIKLAEKENLDIKKISDELTLKYGEKTKSKNLEEIIDQSNIHGWLQDKIHSSEGKMVAWTKFLLENDKNNLSKLEKIYINQGIKAAVEVKSSKNLVTAKDLYTSLNDYILDGMPCDMVNEVILSQDDLVKFKKRKCVHKEIWEKENLDVQIFYDLRNLWIKAFINELNDNFEYIKENDNVFCIRKIKN